MSLEARQSILTDFKQDALTQYQQLRKPFFGLLNNVAQHASMVLSSGFILDWNFTHPSEFPGFLWEVIIDVVTDIFNHDMS